MTVKIYVAAVKLAPVFKDEDLSSTEENNLLKLTSPVRTHIQAHSD